MAGELTYERHRRLSKPKGPTAKYRAKRKRADAAVASAVRATVDERDGYCRLWGVRLPCYGPSEWAHLEEKKRARTRGMAPKERHTTTHSAKMCHRHHAMYDAGQITIELLTLRRGADGLIRVGHDGTWVLR